MLAWTRISREYYKNVRNYCKLYVYKNEEKPLKNIYYLLKVVGPQITMVVR